MAEIAIRDQLQGEKLANTGTTRAPVTPVTAPTAPVGASTAPAGPPPRRQVVEEATTGDNYTTTPEKPVSAIAPAGAAPVVPDTGMEGIQSQRAGERSRVSSEATNPVGSTEEKPPQQVQEPANPLGSTEATPAPPHLVAAIGESLKSRYARGGEIDPGLYDAAAERIAAEIHANAPPGYEEYLTGDVLRAQTEAHAAKVDAEYQKARAQVIAYFSTIGKGNATKEEIDAYTKQHLQNRVELERAEQAAGAWIGEKVSGALTSGAGAATLGLFDVVGRATIDGILGTYGIALQKGAEALGGGRGREEQVTTEAVQQATASLPPVAQQLSNVFLYPIAASETMRVAKARDPYLQEHSVEVGPVRIDVLDVAELALPATGLVGVASRTGRAVKVANEAAKVAEDVARSTKMAEEIVSRIGKENRWTNATGQLQPSGPLVQRNSILGDTFAKRAEQVAANKGEVTAEQAAHRDILAAEVAKRELPKTVGSSVAEARTSGTLFGKFLGGEAGSATIEHATGLKYVKAAADAVRGALGSHATVDVSSHIDDLHIRNNPLAEEQVWTAAKEGAKWGKPTVSESEAAAIRALPTRPEWVQQAVEAWKDLAPGVQNVGKGWYQIARDDIDAIARSSGRFTSTQVAAVFAALSPQKAWDLNSRNALAAVAHWMKNGDESVLPKELQFPDNLRKAEAIMSGVDPEVVLNYGAAKGTGRKVYNFFQNLNGDVSAVTNDRHMATFFEAGGRQPEGKRYEEMANAIKQAALEVGVNPEQMQAGIWHYVRPSEGMSGLDAERYRAPTVKSIEKMSADIAETTKTDGGVTFGQNGPIKKGFSVGVFPDRSVTIEGLPAAEDIAKFVRDNADVLDENHAVGTFHEDGKTILDIVQTPATEKEALALGKQHGQDSIYDLAKGEVIPIPKEGFLAGEGGAAKVGYALGVDAIKAAITKAKGAGKLTPEEEALWDRIAAKTASGEVLNDSERAISGRIRQFVPRSGLTAPAFGGRMASDITKEIQKIPGWEKKGIFHLANAVKSGQGLENVPQPLIDMFTLGNAQMAAKQFGLPIPKDLAEAAKQYPNLLNASTINAGVGAGTASKNLMATLAAGLPQEVVKAGKIQQILNEVGAIANIPRSIKAAFDLSAPLRQGIVLSAAHPIKALGASRDMVKALVNEDFAQKLNQTIRDSKFARSGQPMAQLHSSGMYEVGSVYDKMKLYLAPLGEAPITDAEEAFMTKFLGKLPGYGASNRAYSTFLNKMRADVADAALEAAIQSKRGAMADDELKSLGAFINHASGRGDIPRDYAPALSGIFYSPRFAVSRVQTAVDAGYGVKEHVSRLFGSAETYNRGRAMAASDVAKFTAAGLTLIALAKTAHAAGIKGFGDVDGDPRSAMFGKIKIGNSTIDLWGGFQQIARYSAQLVTGTSTTSGEEKSKEFGQTLAGFAASKRNPVVALLWDVTASHAGSYQDRNKLRKAEQNASSDMPWDQPIGIDFTGNTFSSKDLVGAEFLPMSWGDVAQAMGVEFDPDVATKVASGDFSALIPHLASTDPGDLILGATVSAFSIFGAGVNTRPGEGTTDIPAETNAPAAPVSPRNRFK